MDIELPNTSFIRWQCRRGMLELDIILLSFFDKHFSTLSSIQQNLFVELLALEDQELYEWLTGRTLPTDPALQALVQKIRGLMWKE
jgi:antitoxin CptB